MKFMKLWEYFMQIIINLISVYAQEFYDVKKDLQVCCIKFTTMYMQNEFFEWGGGDVLTAKVIFDWRQQLLHSSYIFTQI